MGGKYEGRAARPQNSLRRDVARKRKSQRLLPGAYPDLGRDCTGAPKLLDPDDQPPRRDEHVAMLGETLDRMRRARARQVEMAPHLARIELQPESYPLHEGVAAAWARRVELRIADEAALVAELAALDGVECVPMVRVPRPPRHIAVVEVAERLRREEAERNRLLSEGKVERKVEHDDGTVERKVEWLEPVDQTWLRVAETGVADGILAEARLYADKLAALAAPASGSVVVASDQVHEHEQTCLREREQLLAAVRRTVARWTPADRRKAEGAIRQLRARARRRTRH